MQTAVLWIVHDSSAIKLSQSRTAGGLYLDLILSYFQLEADVAALCTQKGLDDEIIWKPHSVTAWLIRPIILWRFVAKRCFRPAPSHVEKKRKSKKKKEKTRRNERGEEVCRFPAVVAVVYGSKRKEAAYILLRRRYFSFRVWVSCYGHLISPTMG